MWIEKDEEKKREKLVLMSSISKCGVNTGVRCYPAGLRPRSYCQCEVNREGSGGSSFIHNLAAREDALTSHSMHQYNYVEVFAWCTHMSHAL